MQLPDKRFERALQRDRLSLAALSSNLKRGKNAENVLGDAYFHGYFINVDQSSLLQLSQVAAGRSPSPPPPIPDKLLIAISESRRPLPKAAGHPGNAGFDPSPRQVARAGRRGDRMMGWMAPLRHLSAKLLSDRISSEWEPSMGEARTIGLDLAKHVFQVHGVDAEGATVLRKQLRRAQVLAFFSRLPPCLVGLEACATAHYWARELRALGHEVRLMPAQYV